MIKRPLDVRFKDAVLSGRKFTTIRENAWPVQTPIMLYHWEGKPYRSKHIDVAPVKVLGWWPIEIEHLAGDRTRGEMRYHVGFESSGRLWECEGFSSKEEMDNWFRPLVPEGLSMCRVLMRFKVLEGRVERKLGTREMRIVA